MSQRLAMFVIGLVVGVLFVWLFSGPDIPREREVLVPVRVVEQREPDTVVRWRERIVTRVVRADQVQTAQGGAVDVVERFCARDTVYLEGRSLEVPRDTVALLRSGSLRQGRFFRGDLLTLTGPISTGDLRQLDYRTRGDVSWVVRGDSVIVRSARWALVGDLAEAGVWVGLGYLLGRLR